MSDLPPVLAAVPPTIQYDGSLCGSCTYCCWALGVRDVPMLDHRTSIRKPPGTTCWWVSEKWRSCRIHTCPEYPVPCRQYVCPHVVLQMPDNAHQIRWSGRQLGPLMNGLRVHWQTHRPDAFLDILSEPWVEARAVMPLVPAHIPVDDAIRIIRQTETILAATENRDSTGTNHGWLVVVAKLTAEANGQDGRRMWAAVVDRHA